MDKTIYRCPSTGQFWRVDHTTDDEWLVMFHCDRQGNYDPRTDYAEEFAPFELNQFERIDTP